MIHLPASVRVYLCLTPCDMRKSFDSLQALVREHLELDPFAGHLFVFTSRRKDRAKILYWDRDGFAVWSKRLEEGTYAVPFGDSGAERRREITGQELGALLSGIDLSTAKRRKRYRRAGTLKTFQLTIVFAWKGGRFPRKLYARCLLIRTACRGMQRRCGRSLGSGRTTGSFPGRAEQVSESAARTAGSAAQPQE